MGFACVGRHVGIIHKFTYHLFLIYNHASMHYLFVQAGIASLKQCFSVFCNVLMLSRLVVFSVNL